MKEKDEVQQGSFKNQFANHIQQVLLENVENREIRKFFIKEVIPFNFLPFSVKINHITPNYFLTIGVLLNDEMKDLDSVKKILGLNIFKYLTLYEDTFVDKSVNCLVAEKRNFIEDKSIYRCLLFSAVGYVQVFASHDLDALKKLFSNLNDELEFPRQTIHCFSKKLENFEQTLKQKKN
jgi:hypothetical protein